MENFCAKNSSFPPVRDYVFLSDPDASETFIVERSGRVRLYFEGDSAPLPGLRQKEVLPELLNIHAGLTPPIEWKWQDGYLPILIATGSRGKKIRLFAKGTRLYSASDSKYFSYPDKTEIPAEEWNSRIHELQNHWNSFFVSGRNLPGLEKSVEHAWKSCFVQSLCAFWGLHSKYGVEEYGCMRHDAFPPTILAMCDALFEFGHAEHARNILTNYLRRFLRADGTLDYYGCALSEYGGLLTLASKLSKGVGGREFFMGHKNKLLRIVWSLHNQMNAAMNPPASDFALLSGSPEADLRNEKDEYLHNNLQICRGLLQFTERLEEFAIQPDAMEIKSILAILRRKLSYAIKKLRPCYSMLPYRIKKAAEIANFQADMDWSFANYRYYPEMLEAGLLPPKDARKIINAHYERGGCVNGLTTLNYPAQYLLCFDHWPLASFAKGLLLYGEKKRFRELMDAHLYLYMSPDTFTCYESLLSGSSPTAAYTDWCVPAQLVFPRMLGWSFSFRDYDRTAL